LAEYRSLLGREYGMTEYEKLKPLPGSPAKRAARKLLSKEVEAERVERDWRDFPNLPGRHMSWRKAGRGCWQLIVESNGVVSVRREKKRPRLLRFSTSSVPRCYSFTSQGQTYGWQRVGKRRMAAGSRVADLVNTATNTPVLRITGVHYNDYAGTLVRLWAGQRSILFPVRSSEKCALMSAVDDSGHSLVEYRRRHESLLGVDAVINPNALTVPHIELLVAVTAQLFNGYFSHPSGG
jgi:hypothetical protein